MPNIWTHMMFADKVAKESNIDINKEFKSFFYLGAQGPDPFFYHNFWPWKKEKPVEEVGAHLHYHKCGPFLLDMIKHGAHTEDDKIRTYILGFVTHHILDRNAHPYIIYRSGEAPGKHQKLEVTIDTLIMKKHYGIETWRTPVYKKLFVGKHLYHPIEVMLRGLIFSHFPETANEMPMHYIDQSYRDMLLAQRLLFDPLGWKNKLLGDVVSPYSYQKKTPDKDILNERKTEWLHPTDQSEKHNESFYELWDEGEQEASVILPLIIEYWNNTHDEVLDRLTDALGNRSYDTGKDCTLPITNQYYDPII